VDEALSEHSRCYGDVSQACRQLRNRSGFTDLETARVNPYPWLLDSGWFGSAPMAIGQA